jgi:hypothetical protein
MLDLVLFAEFSYSWTSRPSGILLRSQPLALEAALHQSMQQALYAETRTTTSFAGLSSWFRECFFTFLDFVSIEGRTRVFAFFSFTICIWLCLLGEELEQMAHCGDEWTLHPVLPRFIRVEERSTAFGIFSLHLS